MRRRPACPEQHSGGAKLHGAPFFLSGMAAAPCGRWCLYQGFPDYRHINVPMRLDRIQQSATCNLEGLLARFLYLGSDCIKELLGSRKQAKPGKVQCLLE